jgi:hypothetical protein
MKIKSLKKVKAIPALLVALTALLPFKAANAQFGSSYVLPPSAPSNWIINPANPIYTPTSPDQETEGNQERPRGNNTRIINSSPQPNRSRFNRTSLGTSAERFVGHWFNGLRDHLYISGVNSDGIGSYIVIMLGKRSVYQSNRQYKLINYQGAFVTIQEINSDGTRRGESTYQISENGQVLSEISAGGLVIPTGLRTTYKYVD